MKTIVFNLEIIISGFPGSFELWRRYLIPTFESAFRTISSGFVFLLLIRDMHSVRCSFVKLSILDDSAGYYALDFAFNPKMLGG